MNESVAQMDVVVHTKTKYPCNVIYGMNAVLNQNFSVLFVIKNAIKNPT